MDSKNGKFYIFYSIFRKRNIYFFWDMFPLKCSMSNVLDSFIRELGKKCYRNLSHLKAIPFSVFIYLLWVESLQGWYSLWFSFFLSFFIFLAAKHFVSIYLVQGMEEGSVWLKKWLGLQRRASGRIPETRGAPQSLLGFGSFGSGLRVSFSERYSPSMGVRVRLPACVSWLGGHCSLEFHLLPRKRLSWKSDVGHAAGRTQGREIQMGMVHVLHPENGGFQSILVLPHLSWEISARPRRGHGGFTFSRVPWDHSIGGNRT